MAQENPSYKKYITLGAYQKEMKEHQERRRATALEMQQIKDVLHQVNALPIRDMKDAVCMLLSTEYRRRENLCEYLTTEIARIKADVEKLEKQ